MSDETNELERLRRELEGSNATLRAITPALLNGRGCWTHEEIVSTVNQWFHERKELERLRKQNAPLREALIELIGAAESSHDYNVHGDCCNTCQCLVLAVESGTQALQPDAAARCLTLEQVRPLVAALEWLNSRASGFGSSVQEQVEKALKHAESLGL